MTSSQLATVPVARRRQAALVLGLLAVLLLVAGVLPWTSPAPASVRGLAAVAVVAAIVAVLIAWGLLRSVNLERRRGIEAELDAVLIHAAGSGCACGHDHSEATGPTEATAPITSASLDRAACSSSDGPAGADCPHTCAACVLQRR